MEEEARTWLGEESGFWEGRKSERYTFVNGKYQTSAVEGAQPETTHSKGETSGVPSDFSPSVAPTITITFSILHD